MAQRMSSYREAEGRPRFPVPPRRLLAVGGLAVAALIVLLLVEPFAVRTATFKCGGKKATILGTPGNDRLIGRSASDVIFGDGGNDRILGGPSGNDRICGGPGDDLHGGCGAKAPARGDERRPALRRTAAPATTTCRRRAGQPRRAVLTLRRQLSDRRSRAATTAARRAGATTRRRAARRADYVAGGLGDDPVDGGPARARPHLSAATAATDDRRCRGRRRPRARRPRPRQARRRPRGTRHRLLLRPPPAPSTSISSGASPMATAATRSQPASRTWSAPAIPTLLGNAPRPARRWRRLRRARRSRRRLALGGPAARDRRGEACEEA